MAATSFETAEAFIAELERKDLLKDDPIVMAEYLAEAYLRFAEAATDPDMLATTQGLAGIAIYRLATLRSVAPDIR